MVTITLYAKQKKRHRCTEQTFGLCGRRQGWDVLREQHVYYLQWNRSPAQVGCMRQVLGPGALGRPRGNGWRGRWEGGSGWGIHVTPWLIHLNVWQSPLKCCEVISLQLIKKKLNKFWKKDIKFHENVDRPQNKLAMYKNNPEKNTLNGIHNFPTDHCFNLLIVFRLANLIYHIIWQYTSIL